MYPDPYRKDPRLHLGHLELADWAVVWVDFARLVEIPRSAGNFYKHPDWMYRTIGTPPEFYIRPDPIAGASSVRQDSYFPNPVETVLFDLALVFALVFVLADYSVDYNYRISLPNSRDKPDFYPGPLSPMIQNFRNYQHTPVPYYFHTYSPMAEFADLFDPPETYYLPLPVRPDPSPGENILRSCLLCPAAASKRRF